MSVSASTSASTRVPETQSTTPELRPNRSRRPSAAELIEAVVDPGTFVSWDSTPTQPTADQGYLRDLDAARTKSGTDEAVVTGMGKVRGRLVALVVSEFRFLAGSIGQAAIDRVVRSVRRATAEGLPLLAGPASGGTRMQEGTLAFLGMIAITDAVRRHKEAGLPYLVYLRHPTTGGVMASWGSLGHVTVAEPNALLGPRVFEALYDKQFPENVQTSENLYRKGLIDAVVPMEELPGIIDRALRILTPTEISTDHSAGSRDLHGELGGRGTAEVQPHRALPAEDADTWESILISRRTLRPDTRMVLASADDALPLNGTGQGEKDPGIILALARFGAQSCVVLGQQRPRHPDGAALGPGSLREARRGVRLAEELKLPLVTIIDTLGGELSKDAEEGGIAGEIARSLNDLIGVDTASVSVLLGQGTGGAALALLPADRTVAAEHAWLSPLPPEGASAIIHRDLTHAAEMAEAQRVSVPWLTSFGLVDRVISEDPPAETSPRIFCARLVTAIEEELTKARNIPEIDRLPRRSKKFQTLGQSLNS
ncbi:MULTISPECIES: carboxyl transferase domain-containing protein [unclassified Brevibacterium]|uniref:carboxyl transferase domain-containing protein n=1 Tax=unclassified Brevibacterium TaxID=2614124 RepID=UPI001092A81C|nr:carboxyl transferase domain-containing protein [Brevibacterium sp. S22]TGD29792.1 acetyl-CoA carboxyl transferase [Brevibacterium sp. S22]